MRTVYLVSGWNPLCGWLKTMVRSLQVMGQNWGSQPEIPGDTSNRETTDCRSMARSKVTLIGVSPATLPSPLLGETCSIAGAAGLQPPSDSSNNGKTARTRQDVRRPGLGLITRATLSEAAQPQRRVRRLQRQSAASHQQGPPAWRGRRT